MLRIFIFFLCFFPAFAFAVDSVQRDATYYSDSFEGGNTAHGDIFSQDGYSAALCGLELGQWVHVMYGATGVVVKVNDRPNCDRHPELIDLSKKAFTLLSPIEIGKISNISVTPIGSAPVGLIRKDIPSNIFQSLSVRLETSLSNTYFSGESIVLRGRVLDGKKSVIVYLQNSSSHIEKSELIPVKVDGTFEGVFTFPNESGKYTLILASGNSFQTTLSAPLTLVDERTLAYPNLPIANNRIIPKVDNKNIVLPSSLWGVLKIHQDQQVYNVKGNVLALDTLPLRTGRARVELSGYSIPTGFSLDRSAVIPKLFSGNVILDRVHESSGTTGVKKILGKRSVSIRFKTPYTTRIKPVYYVTTPSGDVLEYTFPLSIVSEDGFLRMNQSININIPLPDDGTYMIEAVQENGVAYFNFPVNRGLVWNILEPMSHEEMTTIRKNINLIRASGIKRINTLRAGLGRNFLVADPILERLAQLKAEDMADRDYFGHQNPEGLYINEFAKQKGIDLKMTIYENIGYGEGLISDLALQDGLEESGSHRHAMILPKIGKVGIGYAKKGEKTYLVQVFGE